MHRGLWGPQWGPPGPLRSFTDPPLSGRGPWTSACGHILCTAWGAVCWCRTQPLWPIPRAWCRRPAGNLQWTPSCRSPRPSARPRHTGNICLVWQVVPRKEIILRSNSPWGFYPFQLPDSPKGASRAGFWRAAALYDKRLLPPSFKSPHVRPVHAS